MPINMFTNQVYKINYEAFRNVFRDKRIFNDPKLQDIYLDKWIQELKKQDMIVCNECMDPNNKIFMLKERAEAPEIFQLPIEYDDNKMYVHFRVSRIIQSLEMMGNYSDDAMDIDLDDFTQKNSDIKWSMTNDKVKIKNTPVIIAPFTIGKYFNWVVVDGNHRITDALEKRKNKIKVIGLDHNWLVEAKMFCSGFDLFLYIFQNEYVALATLIRNENYSDEQALALSYFVSGKVQCYTA